jgi:hypothetical protein
MKSVNRSMVEGIKEGMKPTHIQKIATGQRRISWEHATGQRCISWEHTEEYEAANNKWKYFIKIISSICWQL